MDYTLFPDHRKFFARYIPSDAEDGYQFTDKIQFYVMDLTAMDQATERQKTQGLIEWAKAFKAESWEEVNGIEDPGVKEDEALMTACGGNFIRAEIIRNKRASQREVA